MPSTLHNTQEQIPNTYKCRYSGLYLQCCHGNIQNMYCAISGQPLDGSEVSFEIRDPHNHENRLLIKVLPEFVPQAKSWHEPKLFATTIEASPRFNDD